MGSEGYDDDILLVLPADPTYSRVARVAVSGLAVRLGFDWPAIEDLRIAVDEVLIFLLRPEGAAGEVSFTFHLDDGSLRIEAHTTAGDGQHWDDAAARHRFTQIVTPLVDEHEVDEGNDRVVLHKRLSA